MAPHAVPDREDVLEKDEHDVIVVGAGLCGLVFLKYACEKGLRCVVLEKQDDVGGLWNRLPAWQDIQNRREDFAINGIPLDGVRQPDVHRHVQRWVREFDLARDIRLRTEVSSTSWTGQQWNVHTRRGTYRAPYLVVASGVQSRPWKPDVERSASQVTEVHSSRLERPEALEGRIVTVVGGGASAWDLLDLAIANGAEDTHWSYRSSRWFLPTRRPKQRMWPNLRELALVQSFVRSPDIVSAFLQGLLDQGYDDYGLKEMEPTEPFDVRKHMLIPGRAGMIQNLGRISHHRGEIRALDGREVVMENGERFRSDLVLWATGYRMDLGYLGLPEYDDIDRIDQLLPRLGSLIRSVDYPNLLFQAFRHAIVRGGSITV